MNKSANFSYLDMWTRQIFRVFFPQFSHFRLLNLPKYSSTEPCEFIRDRDNNEEPLNPILHEGKGGGGGGAGQVVPFQSWISSILSHIFI